MLSVAPEINHPVEALDFVDQVPGVSSLQPAVQRQPGQAGDDRGSYKLDHARSFSGQLSSACGTAKPRLMVAGAWWSV